MKEENVMKELKWLLDYNQTLEEIGRSPNWDHVNRIKQLREFLDKQAEETTHISSSEIPF
jgi:hypothetical protein